MTVKFKKIALAVLWLPAVAFANERLDDYKALAVQKNLANSTTWQRLFYVGKGQMSDVKLDDFFLNVNGKADLGAELATTLDRLLTDDGDHSPQCRFPARSEWLIKELNIDKDSLPKPACTEFNEWFQTVNPHKMTLVFASDYMGNPSSMFGHTLVRIDQPKASGNKDLTAFALNYAATPPQGENSASYAIKGLTGKYGGEYSLMRYFHKTKEYGDMESRDLWEYELGLTLSEVQFLVKHIWEMKGVQFPYYFMDKNCSYALLGLIDLVRPNLNLQAKFGWTVIPIETVKAVKKAGLITSTHYRPALESQLKAQEQTHGKTIARTANQLTQKNNNPTEIIANYDKTTQAKLLEMSYDNLYFNQNARTVDREFAQHRLRELLLLRSQNDAPSQRPTVPTPFDPTGGHGATMIGVGVGRSQGQAVRTFDYRVAYHAMNDPQAGYNIGQLAFLNGSLAVQDDKVKLQNLDILSVKSVNPMKSYKRPTSWGTHIGYQQIAIDKDGNFSTTQTHGVGVLAGQMGYAQAFFDNRLVCGGYVRGELQGGGAFEHTVRFGVSPMAECTVRLSDRWQGMMTANLPYWTNTHQWQMQLQGELQYNLNPNNAIRFSTRYEKQDKKDWQKVMLGFYHYY